jgi:hypothetical protein
MEEKAAWNDFAAMDVVDSLSESSCSRNDEKASVDDNACIGILDSN